MYLNYRKTLAVAGTAAAVLGIGGTAMAMSGDHTVAGSAVTPAAAQQAAKADKGEKGKDKAKGHALLRRLEHGQFVTKGKDGAVTHTLWRGTVTAVSPTSVTVQAADKKSQTYVVGKETKVKERVKGQKPADSSISKIAKGDQVMVTGTGTPTVTARAIVELPK